MGQSSDGDDDDADADVVVLVLADAAAVGCVDFAVAVDDAAAVEVSCRCC
jgi:hypothetical protein